MPTKRTFGWIQNPGDLKKLKKVVGVFQADSPIHKWLTTERLPLLMRYKLVNPDDYKTFQAELSKPKIEISYSLLKGKGSGNSGRKNALCSGIVQAVIDAQSSRTYSDSGVSVTIKKPYLMTGRLMVIYAGLFLADFWNTTTSTTPAKSLHSVKNSHYLPMNLLKNTNLWQLPCYHIRQSFASFHF